MLNHGSWVNQKRSEERYEHNKNKEAKVQAVDPVVFHGKRVTELDSDEFMAYWTGTSVTKIFQD